MHHPYNLPGDVRWFRNRSSLDLHSGLGHRTCSHARLGLSPVPTRGLTIAIASTLQLGPPVRLVILFNINSSPITSAARAQGSLAEERLSRRLFGVLLQIYIKTYSLKPKYNCYVCVCVTVLFVLCCFVRVFFVN